MKHSIKSLFPLAGKTASTVRLEIEKMEENRFTTNFKNSVHQQKKAPNKSIKFAVNQKSVSTSQNKEFPEKCDFTEPKSYFHSNQFLLAETRFYMNIGLPLIAVMVSKKNLNERISFPLKRKSVATYCNKGFV